MKNNYWNVLWKKLQKTNQTEFRIKKVIKKRVGKLYVKWKDYGNSFNSWTDKKRCCYIEWAIFQNHIVIAKAK